MEPRRRKGRQPTENQKWEETSSKQQKEVGRYCQPSHGLTRSEELLFVLGYLNVRVAHSTESSFLLIFSRKKLISITITNSQIKIVYSLFYQTKHGTEISNISAYSVAHYLIETLQPSKSR